MSVTSPSQEAPRLPYATSRENGSWSSTSDGSVTTHTGASLPADLHFIAPPPTQDIGKVLSAFSTVRENRGGEKRLLRRVGGTIMGAWLGIIVIVAMGHTFLGVPLTATLFVVALVVGGIPGFLFSAPENATTYVCEAGAVKYVWGGKNNPVKSEKWFRYSEATDLRVSQTRNYTNGIYTGTEWSFLWQRREPSGGRVQEMFKLAGRFYRSKGPADDDETFHFGTAVEAAYSQFHLARSRAILEAGDSVPFAVGMNGVLTVSAKGLEVSLGKKQEFIPAEGIEWIGINEGMVTITRAGFKKGILGIGSEGVYSFAYSELSNARLFLALLGTVLTKPEEAEPAAT